jgi:hypothetical protein
MEEQHPYILSIMYDLAVEKAVINSKAMETIDLEKQVKVPEAAMNFATMMLKKRAGLGTPKVD